MTNYDIINTTKENHRRRLESPEPAPHHVRQVASCIHEMLFTQKLTVGWMKQQCGITSHNFASCFAHYMGRAPKRYIMWHRVAVAKKLLPNDKLANISNSLIAYELGFSSVSSFSKCFKQITGVPPSEWP